MESRNGLHEGQCRMQELLRRALGFAPARDGYPRYRNGFKVTLQQDLIDLPNRWREPRLIFVNSMSDLFHEQVPLRIYPTRVCDDAAMSSAHVSNPNQAKRSAENARIGTRLASECSGWESASRIHGFCRASMIYEGFQPLFAFFLANRSSVRSLRIDLADIHWVIVGGESGWGARPMNIEWVREIFRACRKQDVPFFFKQWGGVRKDLTGRLLSGRTYDEMPVRVAA